MKLQLPITDDNFSSVINYTNNKMTEIHQKKLIRKVIAPIYNIVFFAGASLVTYDLLLKIPNVYVTEYLFSLTFFKNLWTMLSPIIHHPEAHFAIQALIYFSYLILIPFAVCGIVYAIIRILYKPAVKMEQSENLTTDSKNVFDFIREIKIRSKKTNDIDTISLAIVFALGLMALTTHFLLNAVQSPDQNFINQLLLFMAKLSSKGITYTSASLVFVFAWFIYIIISYWGSILLKLFYNTKLDDDIEKATESYYFEKNANAKALFDEEEEILSKAAEIRIKRQKEEEEFLAKINYKNPIFKYIKMGIILVLLIVSVIYTGNKIKQIDIEKYLQLLTESTTESTELIDSEISE